VPFDTTLFRASLDKIFAKNTINRYVYKLYLKDSTYFHNFKNINEFQQSFQLNTNNWKELENYLQADSLQMPKNAEAQKELAVHIKALLARQLFGTTGFYEIMNANNETFKKALQVLQ
jgi:carboxyl-terminal processing protease